jgi:hypothetical protein
MKLNRLLAPIGLGLGLTACGSPLPKNSVGVVTGPDGRSCNTTIVQQDELAPGGPKTGQVVAATAANCIAAGKYPTLLVGDKTITVPPTDVKIDPRRRLATVTIPSEVINKGIVKPASLAALSLSSTDSTLTAQGPNGKTQTVSILNIDPTDEGGILIGLPFEQLNDTQSRRDSGTVWSAIDSVVTPNADAKGRSGGGRSSGGRSSGGFGSPGHHNKSGSATSGGGASGKGFGASTLKSRPTVGKNSFLLGPNRAKKPPATQGQSTTRGTSPSRQTSSKTTVIRSTQFVRYDEPYSGGSPYFVGGSAYYTPYPVFSLPRQTAIYDDNSNQIGRIEYEQLCLKTGTPLVNAGGNVVAIVEGSNLPSKDGKGNCGEGVFAKLVLPTRP